VVNGATDSDCLVYGEDSRLLGSGTADNVEYQVGGEEMAIVTCGSLSSVFIVGTESVTVDSTTTIIATELLGSALQDGVAFLEASMNYLLENENDEFTDEDRTNAIKTMADWLEAYASIESTEVDTTDSSVSALNKVTSSTRNLAKFIANWGDLAALSKSGRTCSSSTVKSYGRSVTCEDLESISMTGYFGVYSTTVNLNDLNDPKNPQPLDATDFRLVFKEGSAMSSLYSAILYKRTYTFSDIYDLITSDSKYDVPFYTETREGVIEYVTPTEAQMLAYMKKITKNLYQAVHNKGNNGVENHIKAQKYYIGYNPGSGPYVDALHYEYTAGGDTSACFPTQPDDANFSNCPYELYRVTLDTDGTYYENAEGNYFLEWGWNTDTVYLKEYSTSYYVRDEKNRIYKYTIDTTTSNDVQTPSDFTSGYFQNHRYNPANNPLLCDDGTTYAFSNAAFRALCTGDYSYIENGYHNPKPEMLSRIYTFLNQIQNWDKLNAYQAYAVIKMLMQASASIPVGEDGSETTEDYAVIQNHEESATTSDILLKNFFDGGVVNVEMKGHGNFAVKDGSLGFAGKKSTLDESGTPHCWITGKGKKKKENCTADSSITINSSGTDVSNGTEYTVSGSFTVTSDTFGTKDIAFTKLLTYKNSRDKKHTARYGRFTAADGSYLDISFSSQITAAVEGDGFVKGKGTFLFLNDI